MAEIKTLLKFDFDTDKAIESMAQLRSQMDTIKQNTKDLRKETNLLSGEYKENADKLAELERNGKKNSKEYKDTTNKLKELNKSLDDTNKQLIKQESSLKLVTDEYKATSTVVNASIQQQNEYASTLDKANEAIGRQNKSIADARENNKELLAIRNQVDVTTAEGLAKVAELNAKIDENTEFIKQNADAYTQQKMNIGNYEQAIISAVGQLSQFGIKVPSALTKATNATKAMGIGADGLGKSLTGAITGVIGLTKASVAFIMTPIGAIITALAVTIGVVTTALGRSTSAVNKITEALAPFEGMINLVMEAISEFGEVVIDNLVKQLEMVEKGITAVISGLAFVLEWLGFKDASASVQGYADAMKDAGEQSKELAKGEKELKKLRSDNLVTTAELKKEIAEQKMIMDDSSKSLAEREKAAIKVNEIEKQLSQQKIKFVEEEIRLNAIRMEQRKGDLSLMAKQKELQAELIDLQTADFELERNSVKKLNSIRNEVASENKRRSDEAAAQRKKAAEDSYNNQMRLMKEEMDFFVASQGFRKKSLQEQYEFEQQLADDQIKVLDFQLKRGKISLKAYQTEVQKIQNELAQTQANLIIENAQDELDAWMRANDSRLSDVKRLNDEIVNEEISRLEQQEQLQIEFQQKRLDEGLITEREFAAESLRITEETEKQRNELFKRYDAERRQAELIEQQLQFEEDMAAMLERGATQFEIKQAQLDQQKEAELLKLDQQREQDLISEDEYQRRLSLIQTDWNRQTELINLQIKELAEKSKLDVTKRALGVFAQMAGEQSGIGKAMAVAQATIDTYQAANAAYKAMAGIPGVGPAWAGVAAGAAVIAGMINVKKIASVKQPKIKGFATGGRISDGQPIRRDNGDDVLITAKKGEVILNEHQQRLAGGSDFFKRLGVPGFASGGVVGSNLASVQKSVQTTDLDIEAIKNAVRDGAAAGSYSGSQTGFKDLSTDREIIQNSAL